MEKIGIIGNAERGEAIGYSFARRKYQVIVYETDRYRANTYRSGEKKEICLKDLNGKPVLKAINPERMIWAENMQDLHECTIIIEAIQTSIELKRKYLERIEPFIPRHCPILTEHYLYLPSDLCGNMQGKHRVVGAYFWDVEYTGTCVELVTHGSTDSQTLDTIKEFLKKGGFFCDHTMECVGYIHNRVGLLGIQNLFRMYDQKVISYDNMGKYSIYNRLKPYVMNLDMKKEIHTELHSLLPLFEKMNTCYGSRFYIPEFYSEKYTKENLEHGIRKTASDRSIPTMHISAYDKSPAASIENVFITGIGLIHSNIAFSLVRNTNVYFDSSVESYLRFFKRYQPKLYHLLSENASFIEENSAQPIDLIIDFSIQEYKDKVETVTSLQKRFGRDIPILLNTPIFWIEDIAAESINPAMVYGMYTQKNYLKNTEIVQTASMDKKMYLHVKDFLKSLAGDIIETRDAPVRPLFLMIASKMLESVRIYEEGLADIQAIEFLGVDRMVFDDIDMFGLDTLVFVATYLRDYYEDVFAIPETITKLVKDNRSGYAAGYGFVNHGHEKR